MPVLFGQKRVTGIDINPIFINLLQNDFLDFTGIGNREDVTLVVDDARSYLSSTREKYSVIQMSLTDTWGVSSLLACALCSPLVPVRPHGIGR